MGEKTFDAIYKIAKEKSIKEVTLWIPFKEIKGTLLCCDENKCLSGIVTLTNVTVKCPVGNQGEMHEKHLDWLNIPACHIIAFTFEAKDNV